MIFHEVAKGILKGKIIFPTNGDGMTGYPYLITQNLAQNGLQI